MQGIFESAEGKQIYINSKGKDYIMEQYEKVEKIAQKTGISFEEAKTVLEANNWDLLDAMLAVERQGKAGNAQQTYSTEYESQPGYKKVEINEDTSKARRKSDTSLWEKIKQLLKKSHINHFTLSKGNREIVSVPIWLAVLVTLWMWKTVFLITIIALIAGCHISFEGPDEGNLSGVKDVSEEVSRSVSTVAREIKESFKQGYNKEMNKSEQHAETVSSQSSDEKDEKSEVKVMSGSEFEAQDFRGFTQGFDSQNGTSNSEMDAQLQQECRNCFDNSVTTEDGKITLEL